MYVPECAFPHDDDDVVAVVGGVQASQPVENPEFIRWENGIHGIPKMHRNCQETLNVEMEKKFILIPIEMVFLDLFGR